MEVQLELPTALVCWFVVGLFCFVFCFLVGGGKVCWCCEGGLGAP